MLMLKKLVKYGNSYALVLDKSILALLNIEERSVVKLRIEGDTLLVKAEKEAKITDSLLLEIENMHRMVPSNGDGNNRVLDVIEETMKKQCKTMGDDPATMEELQKWAPGTENFKKLQQAHQNVMKKYQEDMLAFSSEKFQKEVQELSDKYPGEANSKEFTKAFMALRLQHAPNMAKMDAEMREASIELGYPKAWLTPENCTI